MIRVILDRLVQEVEQALSFPYDAEIEAKATLHRVGFPPLVLRVSVAEAIPDGE